SPPPEIASRLAEAGIVATGGPPQGLVAGVLMVAVKPQIVDTVLPGLRPLVGPGTTIVSIAAGITLAALSGHLGTTATIRAMPNTPAQIGRGMTVAVAGEGVGPS